MEKNREHEMDAGVRCDNSPSPLHYASKYLIALKYYLQGVYKNRVLGAQK